MGYSLGVDLGTTFVAAAVARDGRVEMCALGEGALVSPAVVYLTEDGTTLTGEPALRRGLTCPDRMARDIRRRLGEPTPVLLGGRPHAVGELLGVVLRSVVATVTAREGAAPDQVVLARPAGWGRARQEAFAALPQLAGLPHAALLTEPEAVAMHYAATRPLPESGLVALYSLGGGTFEVTLARSGPDGLGFVGAPQCIERLGGLDLDEALIDLVDRAAGGAVGALDPADPATARALARLREECVHAKEALSDDDEAMVAVQLGAVQRDARVTRAEFEGLIRPMLEHTVGAVWQALRSVQAGPPDLAGILLVGGSTRIPLVARLLEHSLARPVWTNVHAKNAVALGAAAAAAQLTGQATLALPPPPVPPPPPPVSLPPVSAQPPAPLPVQPPDPAPPRVSEQPAPAAPSTPVPGAPAPDAPTSPVPDAPAPDAPTTPVPGAPAPDAPTTPVPAAPAPDAPTTPVPGAPAPDAPSAPAPVAAAPPPPAPVARPYPPPWGPPHPGAGPYPYRPHPPPYPYPPWPGQAQAWPASHLPRNDDAAAGGRRRRPSRWPRLVGGVVLLAVIILLVLAGFAVLTRIRP